jgi:hypothetical protein
MKVISETRSNLAIRFLMGAILTLFCFSQNHKTPPARISDSISVSGNLVRNAALARGQIFLLQFPSPLGISVVRGSNFSLFVNSDSLFQVPDADGIVVLGNSPADLEIVALADTFLQVSASTFGWQCTEVRTQCQGSTHFTSLSAGTRVCFLQNCGVGSSTVSGNLSGAKLSFVTGDDVLQFSSLPLSGVTFAFAESPLIVLSTDRGIETDIFFNAVSDHDNRFALNFSEATERGIFDGTWRPFILLDSEPAYPPLDSPVTMTSKISQATRIIMTLAAWIGAVVVVTLLIRYIIVKGNPSKSRPVHQQGAPRPGFAPNAGELPGQAAEYSDGNSDSDSQSADPAPLPINPNPYETVI